MPSYHSKLEPTQSIGNLAFLSFKTKFRGPILCVKEADLLQPDGSDIIDEALLYFKPNVFFKTFEIQSDSDRVLIYLTLYITQCLRRLQKCNSKDQAIADMYSLAISRFDIPGDPGFPLNAVYSRPSAADEQDLMRQYLLQLRQECGFRLAERVWDKESGKPSKWWLCFAKRKFMDISLGGAGN